VASATEKLIIIADQTKDSTYLGEKWKKGIPLEVSQFGWRVVVDKLNRAGTLLLGYDSDKLAQIRLAEKKMGPVVTDTGNFIVDFKIENLFQSPESLHSPKSLEASLKTIPGILETGLFIGMAHQIYFGREDGTVTSRFPETDS